MGNYYLFKKFFKLSLVGVMNLAVLAHQPRLVGNETQVNVHSPEVSKAYYGELTGKPAIYTINTADFFKLYVNILVPDIKNIDKDVSVEITNNGTLISVLDGLNYKWIEFFEPFGRDNYFKGPNFLPNKNRDNMK